MQRPALRPVPRLTLLIALPVVMVCLQAQAVLALSPFSVPLSEDKMIVHALTRLTFGPRPGEVARVRALGLHRWITLQLHPEQIPENPTLEAKVRSLPSLALDSRQLVLHFPPLHLLTELAKAQEAGRWPAWLSDPVERAQFAQLAQRCARRLAQQALPEEARTARLTALLTPEQVELVQQGNPETIRTLLTFLPADTHEAVLEVVPPATRNRLLPVSPEAERRELFSFSAPLQVIDYDVVNNKLYRAIYSHRQLAELLTDFWYNHFNVFLDKDADRYLVPAYERDVIRPHVLGKFGDLLRATAESPAMLYYLDNWQSRAPQPAAGPAASRATPGTSARGGLNENYARELLELHTLGVDGGYTQRDVSEVARCFTGWTIHDPAHGGPFEFNEKLHDKGEKTVLGITIPAGRGQEDGLQVLEILAHHPATARHIARQLGQCFVADDPPASLIERLAQTFTRTDGDLREVMRVLLTSQEFWSAGAYRAKIKAPFELVVSAVRALQAEVSSAYWLAQYISQLGEPLYRKAEPTGYAVTSDQWLTAATVVGRMNFAQQLTANRLPGVQVEFSRLRPTLWAVPRAVGKELLPEGISEQTRAAIAQAAADTQLGLIAGLVLGSPEFQRQ